MTFGDRLPLLLVAFGIAVACDALLGARDGFAMSLPKDAPATEKRTVAAFRWLNLGLGLGLGLIIATRRRPDLAFGATALWALLGPALVMSGAAVRARRYASEAIPGPRLVDPHTPPTTASLLNWPLQLLHASVITVVCLFFRWTLPHLPSVAPLHWGAEGHVYASPTRLWWSLALVAFNTSLLLFAAWAARGPAKPPPEQRDEGRLDEGRLDEGRRALTRALDVQRRALSVRLVETLLVGLDLVVMAMWVAAIVALLPGQSRGVAPVGAVVAAGLALAVLVLSLLLYVPPLVRARRAERDVAQRSPSAK